LLFDELPFGMNWLRHELSVAHELRMRRIKD